MNDVIRASRSACAYLWAKKFVTGHGFGWEITWQKEVQHSDFDEVDFLRESAWVVLNAGMKETVVRRIFPRIASAFLDWESANAITQVRESCISEALKAFNHRKKIQAIADIAATCDSVGFPEVKARIITSGGSFLQEFPYIGPVTSRHLAKNLGQNIAKPDRHLLRIAKAAGYDCVDSLCSELSSIVLDDIAVIDIVIWRFATLYSDYETVFKDPGSVISARLA